MSLSPGTRLGAYEVSALIGEGGMGQVYRATDTKLNRQVALKILPEAFAADPDRLARFQREAQVLASLNHPGIAAIYGLEDSEGTKALVLELVEGPTLADRIKQGPIPIDEALPIAKQIAEALEAAHEAGVIHRDLKPANIKVKDDGTVKVLDFGLAKALDTTPEGDPSLSPTLTAAATQMGVIMGTAAYMSPEQAAGQTADKHSDLWSFGVVLFEMLTGQRLFTGETVAHVMAKVLERDLDLAVLPTTTPAPIKRLLRRCLERKQKRRLDAGEALAHLEEAATAPAGDSSVAAPVVQPTGWRQALPLALGLAAVTAIISGGAVWSLRTPPPGAPASFVVSAPPSAVPNPPVIETALAISPDGRMIAYRATVDGEEGLYVRPVDSLEGRLLPGTAGARSYFFSPDGTEVGFVSLAALALKKIRVSGGPVTTLCPMPSRSRGASWGPDDTIIFARQGAGTGLFRVSAAGGEPEVLTTPEAPNSDRWPEVLPNGRGVLFATGSSLENVQLAVFDLDTGNRRVLPLNGSHPRYLSSGHLVYNVEDTLWAVGFDADQLDVVGDPIPVRDGVPMTGAGGADVAVSADGALVYQVGGAQGARRTLVWVDRREGEMTTPLLEGSGLAMPRLSPNGTRVVFSLAAETGGRDMWMRDLESGRDTKLTDRSAFNTYPAWTPDGTTVTFSSSRGGSPQLYARPVDLSREAELLQPTERANFPGSWTPDGQTLVYYNLGGEGARNIWRLPVGGEAVAFLATEFNERAPRLSPNGKWLAYISDQPGQDQVFVQAFPEGGSVFPVSTGPGTEAVWSRDGRELFYRNGDQLWVVDVETETEFRVGSPSVLFEAPYAHDINEQGNPNYDVSLDGQQFLMIPLTAADAGDIILVQNWTEELKRLVPVN